MKRYNLIYTCLNLLLTLSISALSACDGSDSRQAEKQGTLERSTQDKTVEEYELVSPSELNLALMDFSGVQEIGEGGTRILGGTFGELRCEGKVIAVNSNKIEKGFISTRDYGKIKVSADTFGGLNIYLTATQKAKLMKLKSHVQEE